jgi:hypothetical protein
LAIIAIVISSTNNLLASGVVNKAAVNSGFQIAFKTAAIISGLSGEWQSLELKT